MRKPAPVTSLVSFEVRRAAPGMFTMGSRSVLDSHNLDAQLVTQADLEQLRSLIDSMLPRQAHNHESHDPDGHVVFDSVCCGAQLYRCTEAAYERYGRTPSKPIIRQGEGACRSCGQALAQF